MPRGLSVELVVAGRDRDRGRVRPGRGDDGRGRQALRVHDDVALPARGEQGRARAADARRGARHRARVASPRTGAPGWSSGRGRCSRSSTRHPWGIDVPITGILGTHAQLSWLDRGAGGDGGDRARRRRKAEIALLLNGYVFWSARLRFQVPQEAHRRHPARARHAQYPSLASAVAGGIFEDGSTPRGRLRVRPRARAGRRGGADRAAVRVG